MDAEIQALRDEIDRLSRRLEQLELSSRTPATETIAPPQDARRQLEDHLPGYRIETTTLTIEGVPWMVELPVRRRSKVT